MAKKKPSKKQLAARKKFVAMVRKRAKEKKKAKIGLLPMMAKYAAGKMLKKKTGIGDTLVRIPSNTRKTKRVTLKRGDAGRFAEVGSIGTDKGYFSSMADLKSENKLNGFYFFSPQTMKFFNSKIVSPLLAGRYFITSEVQTFSTGAKEKLFSIRIANKNASIDTVDKKFKTKAAAINHLQKNLLK